MGEVGSISTFTHGPEFVSSITENESLDGPKKLSQVPFWQLSKQCTVSQKFAKDPILKQMLT